MSFATTALAEPAADVDLATFRAQIHAAERVVEACRLSAPACQDPRLPEEEHVRAGDGVPAFSAEWQWMAEALETARKASPENRARFMREASDRLTEIDAETTQEGETIRPTLFQRARASAAAVLSRGEFRTAEGPTWFDRQLAKIQDWFLRLFLGMDRLGARNPWLAPLIEWACFGIAAGGLIFFVRRSLARQSLRIALDGTRTLAGSTDRSAGEWLRLAEERSAAADWREAIHCLYWAAIASLEGRRAWRSNATRTPREYLRLLRPGSPAQSSLRDLTVRFERVWYGHAEASETDFRSAKASFTAIQDLDLRGPTLPQSGVRTPLEAA